jgi:hypothetical protein
MKRLLLIPFLFPISVGGQTLKKKPEATQSDAVSRLATLKRLATEGSKGAQVLIGAAYADGDGVPQDDREAVRWYRMAAEGGYETAQAILGKCYATGTGVPQNYADAVRWSRKAAEHGEVAAQGLLGVCYLLGRGVPKNYSEAYVWLSLAVANRSPLDGENSNPEFRAEAEKNLSAQALKKAQNRAQKIHEQIQARKEKR